MISGKAVSFWSMGFAAESCVNPASSLLGKAGEGSIIGPEHISSGLEEEGLIFSSV